MDRSSSIVAGTPMNRRLLLLLLVPLGGCGDDGSPASSASNSAPTAPSAPRSSSASASASAPAARPTSSADIEPVYPKVAPTNATAERICKLLHELPSDRVGSCCEAKPSTPFLGECTRTLSYAIDSGAVRVTDEAVASCEAAQQKALDGCGWVRSSLPRPAEACTSILVGTRTRGQACRSALECADGDACLGLSATTIGLCSEPKSASGMCQTGIDTLATYTFADVEKHHPECKGVCDKLRCRDVTAIGAPCTTHLECGAANRCESGTCREGAPPALGEACKDGLACGGNLRCTAGACAAAGAEGASCKTNVDCLGTCASGSCKRACPGAVTLPGTQRR